LALQLLVKVPKFNDAMTKALADLDTCKTGDAFVAMANKFDRIAMAEKNQWLPFYYSGLARATAIYVYNDASKIDAILDIAEKKCRYCRFINA
jgi:hypothetical protein